MLYPQINEKRLVLSLDGIWDFCLGNENFEEKYLLNKLKNPEKIYVPASYNDQKADIRFRDHYGFAYYQTMFCAPVSDDRVVLRFGAVTHFCVVYLNSVKIAEHKGGFLPFEIELDKSSLKPQNLLAVAVDNRINFSTLPVGNEYKQAMFGDGLPSFESVKKTDIKKKNYPNFDFFNYAGINRPVKLYTTSKDYIKDVYVDANIDGVVNVKVDVVGAGDVTVAIFDMNNNQVGFGCANEDIKIKDVVLWEPGNAYLYTAKICFNNDVYYQKFGVRSVEVKGDKFLINNKPFYFKGFGKHEDSEVVGRGINQAFNVKDLSLIKWLNANSFRTSHYPYSEEMLSLCDEEGVVVIAEAPAVGLNESSYEKVFSYHQDVIKQMIDRDKNHPSIVMWSVANEPNTDSKPDMAYDYFKPLYDLTHKIDPQNRPVTIVVCNNDYVKDRVATLGDVVCINRYYGWYIFGGDLDAAVQAMDVEMKHFEGFGKPLMITEYGADAVVGVHNAVGNMFSEEFQMEYYAKINSVLDKYSFVVGEQAWNFADFATIQGTLRVDGNKKGLFTRERRPKLAAHYFKNRWSNIPNFNFK